MAAATRAATKHQAAGLGQAFMLHIFFQAFMHAHLPARGTLRARQLARRLVDGLLGAGLQVGEGQVGGVGF